MFSVLDALNYDIEHILFSHRNFAAVSEQFLLELFGGDMEGSMSYGQFKQAVKKLGHTVTGR